MAATTAAQIAREQLAALRQLDRARGDRVGNGATVTAYERRRAELDRAMSFVDHDLAGLLTEEDKLARRVQEARSYLVDRPELRMRLASTRRELRARLASR